LRGDLKLGNYLLKKYGGVHRRILGNIGKDILKDVWESLVWKNPWNETSRVLFGLPRNWNDIDIATNITLMEFTRQKHSVTLAWLEEYGICGDWITVKNSTIPQAGRGAFTRRQFYPGEIVSPFPLIHIPYRKYLDMYEMKKDESGDFEATKKKVTTQLLLNYCMGHRESTMLLCPYGTLSSFINHNQTLVNVEIVWAEPKNSNHHPNWQNKSLSELYETSYAGLAMNLKAIREVREGEEIFLNYGDEWESAWKKHVDDWAPVEGAKDYMSAEQHNSEVGTINTESEALLKPYPDNVMIHVNLAFVQPRENWMKHWREGTLADFIVIEDEYTSECDILRRESDEEGNVWYAVQFNMTDDNAGNEELRLLENLPREAFIFFDKPHTTDMHQLSALRHEIQIPDSIFPEIWKNIKSSF